MNSSEQKEDSAASRWVWCSTPDSYAKGAISALALLETLVCMVAYGYIAISHGTLHLTLAVLVAPLLLLRTDESVRFALRHSKSLQHNERRDLLPKSTPLRLALAGLVVLGMAILSIFLLVMLVSYFEPEQPISKAPEAARNFGPNSYESLIDREIIIFESGGKRPPKLRLKEMLSSIPRSDDDPMAEKFAESMSNIQPSPRRFAYPGIKEMVWGISLVSVLGIGASLLYLLCAPLLLRAIATLHGVYIDPMKAIYSIPINWWRHVACLDTMHPPEILPGAIVRDRGQHIVSPLQPFGYFLNGIMHDTISRQEFILLLSAIPAYVYRWSLKGTSILLLPLVWLTLDAKDTKPEYFIKSSLVKALYRFSCVVVLLALGGLFARYLGVDFGLLDPLNKITQAKDKFGVVSALFPRKNVPVWQVFAFATSALTISVFLFAERLSNRGQFNDLQSRCFRFSLTAIGLLAVGLIFSLAFTLASITIP